MGLFRKTSRARRAGDRYSGQRAAGERRGRASRNQPSRPPVHARRPPLLLRVRGSRQSARSRARSTDPCQRSDRRLPTEDRAVIVALAIASGRRLDSGGRLSRRLDERCHPVAAGSTRTQLASTGGGLGSPARRCRRAGSVVRDDHLRGGAGGFVVLDTQQRAAGTDVGMLPSQAARELGGRGIRAVRVDDDEPGFPARILEVYGPDGDGPLKSIRSIVAAHDGGEWIFETAGEPLKFERLDEYTRRRRSVASPAHCCSSTSESWTCPSTPSPTGAAR
jgi:hypothetical protein